MRITDLERDRVPEAVALWHDCGLTRPWNDAEADARRALAGPASTVLAALAPEGALLGTAMVGHDGHRGWVYYLAVAPGARRRGTGRALMAAAEQWLRRRGAPKVQLMVRDGNEQAHGFYAALGYTDQETTVLGRFLDPALQRLKERQRTR
ncbi:GNAT family acetyltransferase [Ornithinicoccus halotolerans]|uniref:GNAT family acetyltransferase n=1 Tax=Ornithinicoccus halotolerans TaxID=1748220 RepID=UPI001E39F41E|nr:GNAT family acetyltransferase [Ornithinicoccus halotolerans]